MAKEPAPLPIIARRICWPFDAVCLQGGCGYCNDKPFRPLDQISTRALSRGLMGDYLWGLEHGFANAEVLRQLPYDNVGPKMTKADLIEAMKGFPDDTPVVVDIAENRASARYRYLTQSDLDTQPVVWAVAENQGRIVLEL